MTQHAKYMRERYEEMKRLKLCVEKCGASVSGGRFVRCKECRKRKAADKRKWFKDPKNYKKWRRCTDELRNYRAKRGLCLAHGKEKPCFECAETNHDQGVRRGYTYQRACTRCGNKGHLRNSTLCPLRFKVSTEEYATARNEWV